MADEANMTTPTEVNPAESSDHPPNQEKDSVQEIGTETTKTDGDAVAAKVLVAPTENPFGVDDFEHILQMEASEGADSGWEQTKKTDGVVVFKKTDQSSESNVYKAFVLLPGIPLDQALDLIKGYEDERKKWDKDNSFETLAQNNDFSILYWIMKMPAPCTDRDFVVASTMRTDEDSKRYIILYKDCEHPDKPPNSTYTRGESLVNGVIIRPDATDSESSKITLIQQLNMKGWIPKFVSNRVNVARALRLREQIIDYKSAVSETKPTENGLSENNGEKGEIKPSEEEKEEQKPEEEITKGEGEEGKE